MYGYFSVEDYLREKKYESISENLNKILLED